MEFVGSLNANELTMLFEAIFRFNLNFDENKRYTVGIYPTYYANRMTGFVEEKCNNYDIDDCVVLQRISSVFSRHTFQEGNRSSSVPII